eukprot:8437015-Prorocentrum_lima.AAC.1
MALNKEMEMNTEGEEGGEPRQMEIVKVQELVDKGPPENKGNGDLTHVNRNDENTPDEWIPM